MRCINPYRMRNPNFPQESTLKYIDCACGKCYPCLVNKRRQWFFRLSQHAIYNNGTSFFVSLDYAPEYCDMNLHKDHLQKFFKRLRHHCNFKYYSIGEFGTSPTGTHRPHYHALIFFDSPITKDFCEIISSSCWKYGRVDVADVEPASINYVLHYHIRPKQPFEDDKNKKTFACMSQGLGLAFLDNNVGSLLHLLTSSNNRRITDPNNNSFVLPRYYVKKLHEYGLPVKEYDGSNIDWSQSNMRDYIQQLDKDIKFYSDGNPKEEYEDRFCQLMWDIMSEDKRKINKYNTQDKF